MKDEKLDRSHPAFMEAAAPFFNIVMGGLKGATDGEQLLERRGG